MAPSDKVRFKQLEEITEGEEFMQDIQNVILVVIDSLRQDHVGAYGNNWIRTPNLDAFCSESVMFDHIYPESLPTLPFRRSLFTGKRTFPFRDWKPAPAFYPFSTVFGADGLIPGWNPVPAEDTMLSELLDQRGWNTALVTDCFHQHNPGMNYHRGYHSWQFIRGQEYDPWKLDTRPGQEDPARKHMTPGMRTEGRKTWELSRYLVNNDPRSCEEDYFPAQVFRYASAWIEKNYQSERFFLCIDCFDPHEPWDPPQYYRDMYNPGYQGVEVIMPLYCEGYQDYLSDKELKHMRALYAGEVSLVDTWFGYFINKVRLLGLDKNSLIVVISDHGHQLGEKGFTGKLPWGMMPCMMDLVLAIRHPNKSGAGKRINALTLNHDVFPTILGLCKEEVPGWTEGHDLWPLVTGEKKQIRDIVTCCFKDYFWIRDHHYAMITKSDKTEQELYDIKKDPEYLTDIGSDHPGILEKMWNRLVEEAGGDIPIYHTKEQILDRNK